MIMNSQDHLLGMGVFSGQPGVGSLKSDSELIPKVFISANSLEKLTYPHILTKGKARARKMPNRKNKAREGNSHHPVGLSFIDGTTRGID